MRGAGYGVKEVLTLMVAPGGAYSGLCRLITSVIEVQVRLRQNGTPPPIISASSSSVQRLVGRSGCGVTNPASTSRTTALGQSAVESLSKECAREAFGVADAL